MSLIENHSIQGYFYKVGTNTFRKQLEIKLVKTKKNIPDLMVIMMNPGSSKPLNELDNGRKLTPTKPDNTQKQIVQVMKNCNFEFARILNLSDLREPKSARFYKRMNTLDSNHSIFHSNRANDFNELFQENIPVIYAWGVNKNLQPLAELALKKTVNSHIKIGVAKLNNEYAYYHPLPRSHKKQEEWVESIEMSLKKLETKNNVHS